MRGTSPPNTKTSTAMTIAAAISAGIGQRSRTRTSATAASAGINAHHGDAAANTLGTMAPDTVSPSAPAASAISR